MDVQQIKSLGLTVNDFELIIKGLDAIPSSERSGELMGGVLDMLLSRSDPGAAAEIKRKMDIERAKRKRELDIMMEDVKLLQGKLIMLKRLLIENDLMESLL